MEKTYELHERKIQLITELIKNKFGISFKDILIIGCGSGLEVLTFRSIFKSRKVGWLE